MISIEDIINEKSFFNPRKCKKIIWTTKIK